MEEILQSRMYEMLAGMEETAVALEMKMRFLDIIRDMKQELAEPLSAEELRKKSLEIDELVRELKKQVMPESREVISDEVISVTEREVEERVRGFLEECKGANQEILLNDRRGYVTYVQEAERDMRDLSNVHANYGAVTDAAQFCDGFYKAGDRLNGRVGQLAEVCVDNLTDNYDHAIERTGKLLSDTGYRSMMQRELYTKWSVFSEGIKGELREKAVQLDYGAQAIRSFADEHVGPVQKIIAKMKKKCMCIKLIPLFVISAALVVLLILYVVGHVTSGGIAAEQVSENGLSGTADVLARLVNLSGGFFGSFGMMKWIVGLAAVFYVVWRSFMRYLDKCLRKWICDAVGKYLVEEIGAFWKTEAVHRQIERSFGQIGAQAELLCGEKINEIFGGVIYDPAQNEESGVGRMLKLCRDWEQIKRSAI